MTALTLTGPRVRRWTLAVVASLALATAGGPTPRAQEPLKVGFVYVSPVGDAGWTFQHDQGRKEMEAAFGGRIRTKYVENVPESADAERVVREFATSGYRLVFTTSFGYMNPTLKVAQRFPHTIFLHATGYKRAVNVGTYNARFYEGRYLCGIVAGRMTRSNVAGYVATYPIPEVVQGIDAFTLGLRRVNPKATVKVVWLNAWYDPGREREAAATLVAQGADVLTHHTNSPAVVQIAEEKGVFALGYHSNMAKYGPKAHLTASTHQWGAFYTRIAREVLAGTWRSTGVWGGIKDGMVVLAPFNPAVPADVVALVKATEQEIAAGTKHPFTGPIRDNSGRERLAAGRTMPDDELAVLDFYVEGVQGGPLRK